MNFSRSHNTASLQQSGIFFSIYILVLLLISTPVFSEIRNSKHDFSSSGNGGIWGSRTVDQVCIFCHTPHSASNNIVPLWNREGVSTTYSIYSSPTLNTAVGNPSGVTKMCLSCHDGTVAIDSFNGNTPQLMSLGQVYYPGSPYGENGPNIGGFYMQNGISDLTNDHPVSFSYTQSLAVADGDLKNPQDLPINLPLFDGKLECATCHDVHNKESNGAPALLRINPQGGNLCLSCHIK